MKNNGATAWQHWPWFQFKFVFVWWPVCWQGRALVFVMYGMIGVAVITPPDVRDAVLSSSGDRSVLCLLHVRGQQNRISKNMAALSHYFLET
jgi:hypothetical protein